MSTPSTVTKRAQNNDFVATTGILLSGVSGFGYTTGFYLTNSGSHSIETSIKEDASSDYPYAFSFPSGKKFTITPGANKFIPFTFTSVYPEGNIGFGSSGPYGNGTYIETFRITNKSAFDGSVDTNINLLVTGQVSGFGSLPLVDAEGNIGTGPLTSNKPQNISGFRVVTDYAKDGRPQTTLRWYHPETGYYLTEYKIEVATNITNDNSSATGTWSELTQTYDGTVGTSPKSPFLINYDTVTINDPTIGSFTQTLYATTDGIRQKYSSNSNETTNPAVNYGEILHKNLDNDTDYYYRIRSQYRDSDGVASSQGKYIYGYPVDNFDEVISNIDVNTGLASGSSTLPTNADSPGTSPAAIKNTTGPRSAMIVQLEDKIDAYSHINLKTVFDQELTDRGINKNYFTAGESEYVFTGVKFVVGENAIIGSKDVNYAGIETGEPITDNNSQEINTVLKLEKGSQVLGMGGKGGDGGYQELLPTLDGDKIYARQQDGGVFVRAGAVKQSKFGGNASSAIKITSASITKFRLEKDFTSIIAGGGGGGAGGDISYFPKGFVIKDRLEEQDKSLYNDTILFSPRTRTERQSQGGSTYYQANASNRHYIPQDGVLRVGIATDSKSVSVRSSGGGGGSNILYHGPESMFIMEYNYSDMIGTFMAGVGGGGQGFGESKPGISLRVQDQLIEIGKLDVDLTSDGLKGNRLQFGKGSEFSRRGKMSPGSNGGALGLDGESATDLNASRFYSIQGGPPTINAIGGAGGNAIEVIDGSGYDDFSKFLFFGDSSVAPSRTNYPDLIAHFEADSQYLYSDRAGTNLIPDADHNGRNVGYWKNTDATLSDIYLKNPSTWTKMEYTQGVATIQQRNRTDFFNGSSVVGCWDFHRRAFMLHGATSNADGVDPSAIYKLHPNMDSFEIVYFLAPLLEYNLIDYPDSKAPTHAQFFSTKVGGQFRTGHSSNLTVNTGVKGWALHHWSNTNPLHVPLNDRHPSVSWSSPSMFYDTRGFIRENTGLPRGKSVTFNDFTGGVSPNRAWMYSISASKFGANTIRYSVFNDLTSVTNQIVEGNKFNWVDNPTIGGSYTRQYNGLVPFFGGISDLLIFRKSLTPNERRSLFNYFCRTKLRLPDSTVYHARTHASYTYNQGRNRLVYFDIDFRSAGQSIGDIKIGRKFYFKNPSGTVTFVGIATRYIQNPATGVYMDLHRIADVSATIPTSTLVDIYPNPDENNSGSTNNFKGFNIVSYENRKV